MQPMGRRKIKYNFEDNHPPKGYINWWEHRNFSKKSDRQEAKKECNTNEYEDEISDIDIESIEDFKE